MKRKMPKQSIIVAVAEAQKRYKINDSFFLLWCFTYYN